MALKVVSESQFEAEVLRSELPVLVEFFATWCAPCKQVAPEVEALAAELEGKAKVVKVDIDQCKRLAQMLRIQAVPTFMAFAQGRPVGMEQGVVRRAKLRELVEPFLPRAQGAVTAAELAQLLRAGEVVAVDTRDGASYGRAHLPGAKHMPLEQIEQRLAELHMLSAPAVLYCRGGDRSRALCDKLGREGVPVAFLEGGLLAWEAEGLPVERPD